MYGRVGNVVAVVTVTSEVEACAGPGKGSVETKRAGRHGVVNNKKDMQSKEVVIGVWRYRQVSGEVYVQYNEHTKKVVGLARSVGAEFAKCGLDGLIAEVNKAERDESKGKGRAKGR